MNCPKCGYPKADGAECPRCGLIFARYQSVLKPQDSSRPPAAGGEPAAPGPFRRLYRIVRWIVLVGLLLAVSLLFRTPAPPQIEATPEAAKRAEAKIHEFRSSMVQGGRQRLVMDQAELNGWLSENLAIKKPEASGPSDARASASSEDADGPAAEQPPIDGESLKQLQSSVRDVKIELLEDSLRIYARFELHGVEMSLELEGRPVVRNGYIRLEPSGGKLGSLPLAAGTLKSATDRLFDSPQNKEKFRLPPGIRDVRIEQGRLVIFSR